jgi:hypothetical protein
VTVGLVSALLLPALAFGLRVAAQAPNAGASTLTGIYSPEQARRGEDTYMSLCVGCHPAGTYATEAFKTTWSGRSLGDLFTLISETMPKNEPGSLSPQEYAQVVAYILKVNGLPAGKTDIPTDIARLKQIRFELPGHSQKKEHVRPHASAGPSVEALNAERRPPSPRLRRATFDGERARRLEGSGLPRRSTPRSRRSGGGRWDQ